MRTRKPKLASGDTIVVDVHDGNHPGLGQGSVINTAPTGEPLPKRALRSVVGFSLLGLTMLFLTYVVLATTVFVVMRADGNNVGVLRNTFPIGQAPTGALVYASSSPVDQSVLGKAEQAVFGVSAGSVVEIVAGPAAAISTNKDGFIVADGTATKYTGQTDARNLQDQYIAICISGACQDGAAVIIGQADIVGEVKGYLTTGGFQMPDTNQS